MAYTSVKFFGASVRGCNSSIGWNEQKSTLSAQLVVDASDGDSFTCLKADGTINPNVMGLPAYFQLGSFRFAGLLQKCEKKNDTGGLPTYDVVVEDPRDILANCEVILSGYSGSVGGVRNLLNPFGYWENRVGYGSSYVNSSGMPWGQVRPAIIGLVNTPTVGLYGGPLHFRGVNYGLDISQLPTTPSYYRVGGGTSISLMEIISQICADGGCDYFVELVGTTIRIRTVSRRTQPPLGTISDITDTNWGGTVIRSNSGLEVRNEITSAFVIGGPVSTLHLTSGIASFWGYDINGNPILGVPGRFDFIRGQSQAEVDGTYTSRETLIKFYDPVGQFIATPLPFDIRVGSEIMTAVRLERNNVATATYQVVRGTRGSQAASMRDGAIAHVSLASVSTEYVNLNASDVADILGTTFYSTTTLEMRFALVGMSSWSAYMMHHRTALAKQLKIAPFLNEVEAGRLVLPRELVNDKRDNAQAMARALKGGTEYINVHQVYEFVRRYAQDYLGKKYAVSIPFLLQQQDPETLRVTTSYNVADGGYLPEGSSPLGLSLWNEDVFKNADGTFRGFVRYDSLVGANLTTVPAESALEPPGVASLASKLFLPCNVDPHILYTPSPAVVITVGEGLFDRAVDTAGSNTALAGSFMHTDEQQQKVNKNKAFGTIDAAIHPAPRAPSAAAIPLRSNTQTYGPWYASVANGKVRFDQDTNLVPWEYGGFDNMSRAGTARVVQAVTAMQVAEAGAMELAAPPQFSLGDTMQTGGPNITNIGVSYGANGVTTSYSFSTWTPRFGVFNRQTAERFRKLGQTSQELRRAVRTALVGEQDRRETIAKAGAARRAFLKGAPRAMVQKTPHEVFVSRSVYDPAIEKTRTGVSTSTYQEAIPFVGPDDDSDFQASAAMSLEGLLRPFTTDRATSLLMPSMDLEDEDETGLNATLLNPWKAQNDIEIYTWGSTYEGMHAFRREPDLTGGVRAMGLRLPLMGVGWGYDWEGEPVPSFRDVLYTEAGVEIPASSTSPIDGGFPTGYLNRPDWWAAGPLDVLYDRRRGVWTVHDVVKGYEQGSIPVGETGAFSVYRGIAEDYDITVERWDGDMAFFVAHDRKWYLLSNGGESPIPTGAPYTVYWQGPSGSPSWEGSPFLTSISLGGDEVGEDGYVELGTSISPFTTRLATQDRFSDASITFPANDPGTGYVLISTAVNGDEIELSWVSLAETGGYTFHEPEFITEGREVSANWGDDIQPIGWLDYEGSGELFAREDHEHSHPVFASGDLHPEYNLPTGTIYSVLWSEGGGSDKEWSQEPNIRGLILGNSTLGHGYADYYGDSNYRTRLRGGDIGEDVELILPETAPVVGYTLKVGTYAASSAQLVWAEDSTGSGTLPASSPYSVLWSDSVGVVSWSTAPEISYLVVGTGTADGYVSYSSAGTPYFLSMYPGVGMTDNLDILFPPGTGDPGQVLGVTGRTGNRVTLDWTQGIPTSSPYSLLWANGSNVVGWSSAPEIEGISLGATAEGYVALRDASLAYHLNLYPGDMMTDSMTINFPPGTGDPSCLLGVVARTGNEMSLDWIQPWPPRPTPGTGREMMSTDATSNLSWSQYPEAMGIILGDGSVNDAYVAIQGYGAGKYYFEGADGRGSDIHMEFPADDPEAGELLRVTSFSSSIATLEWGQACDPQINDPGATNKPAGYLWYNTSAQTLWASNGGGSWTVFLPSGY